MNWARRPAVWLTLSLLATSVLGRVLLNTDSCVLLSERERSSYGMLPAWRAGFDSLSAVCGVGLLTRDLEEQYTSTGRWVLLGLGGVGAMLHLAAARQALGRVFAGGGVNLPSVRTILVAFLGIQLALIVAVAVAGRLTSGATPIGDSIWQTIVAFSSLGWAREGLVSSRICAIVAFIGALGWPVWLVVVRRVARARWVLAAVLCYVGVLAVSAGLVAALETPRRTTHAGTAGERLSEHPFAQRFTRSLVQVTCASGAGIATEQLAARGVSEGTKSVLAGVAIVGGLGGAVGGGCKLPALLLVLTAGGACIVRGCVRGNSGISRRLLAAATLCVASLAILTIVVACGLLLIETLTGSGYQTPPTLGDAILEAASAVGGANLSTGLTAGLSSPNLSSGIRQSVDLYQYGMAWLMLAMLIGRILPVLVFDRAAGTPTEESPSGTGEPACPYLV